MSVARVLLALLVSAGGVAATADAGAQGSAVAQKVQGLAAAGDHEGLARLLHDSFLHRRKMLKKSLSADRLAAAGIDARARPQNVAPEQWKALLTVPPL